MIEQIFEMVATGFLLGMGFSVAVVVVGWSGWAIREFYHGWRDAKADRDFLNGK